MSVDEVIWCVMIYGAYSVSVDKGPVACHGNGPYKVSEDKENVMYHYIKVI